MKKGISLFQIGIFVACGVGIVFSVLIFSGKIPLGNKSDTETLSGSVTMWGTLPFEGMRPIITAINGTYEQVNFQYVEKDPRTFQTELVEALANGEGPDLITLTPSETMANRPRILEIPFTNLPESLYLGTFVDQASLYMTDTGVLAIPLMIDPMMMYYNRDMLTSSFVVKPPETWDEVVALNKLVTRKDDAGKLAVETVAMGTFDNITHAKDLIAMLIFQAGNPIIRYEPEVRKFVSTFADSGNEDMPTATKAIDFYTRFANPSQADHYSWNATMPNDLNQFISGKLALYFGYASEVLDIRKKNPNLNFDVAMMPQRAINPVKITYGNMIGVAITKASKNIPTAIQIAQMLAKQEAITNYLAIDPTLVPARRDMLSAPTGGAIQTKFYQSAIISRGWVDPDPVQTTALFRKYIGEINAGLAVPVSIINPGNALMKSILDKVQKSPVQ